MNYPTVDPCDARTVFYVGLDVDDVAFHGYALGQDKEEGFEFKTKPSCADLIQTLEKFQKTASSLKICYEAGYLGYSLQRDLVERGYACEVIAPSLIPHSPGHKVKTDRLDARKLALYYKKGLLTSVHVPDKEQEAVRDLLRSKQFIKRQVQRIRQHLLSLTRRLGFHYRQETNNPNGIYWTKMHLDWLKGRIARFETSALKINFSFLLSRLDALEEEVRSYDCQIQSLAFEPAYRSKVKALTCYKGIDTLSAMTLVSEIGDIRRFSHPRRLTSYSGMDIIEHSSGGKERKFCMSKMGNKYIRTCVIEACQFITRFLIISKKLKERRKDTPVHLVQIADRCMARLAKKSRNLFYRGKPINKIKAACAREMLGFVWESLRAVA